jgi:hypothetical protein
MAYTINKTSGAVLTTVADGTLDTTTDVTLIGKNYPGYGETLNENFVRLLENFANTSAPTSPVAGQIWWDITNSLLKVYTGSAFKNISSSTASASAPITSVVGDLWWDTGTAQLKAYNGSTFTTIGPAFTSGTGTSGAIVETVTDSLAVSHTIVSLYAGNTRVAIVSKDTVFTPSPAISGFATIAPGINLAGTGVIPNNAFTGGVTNAQTLNGLSSTDFMRATANTSTTGTVAVSNNTGLTVGLNADAKISVASSNIIFENQSNGGAITLRVRDSGGTQSNAITASNSGNVTVAKNLTPSIDNTYDLGSPVLTWSTVYATTFDGVAVAAEYADLAERYEADEVYVAGTIVKIGGIKEITAATENDEIFGVISTNPAFLMNKDAGTDDSHPPVALIGRVPVRAIGIVNKGQALVAGNSGIARAATADDARHLYIGRALKDKYNTEEALLEITLTNR